MNPNRKIRAYFSLLLSVLLLFSSAPTAFGAELSSGTNLSAAEWEAGAEAQSDTNGSSDEISSTSEPEADTVSSEASDTADEEILSEAVPEGEDADPAGSAASSATEAAGASSEKRYIDISSVVYQAGAIPSKEELKAFGIGEQGYVYSEEDPFTKALLAAADAYVSGDELELDITKFALTPMEAAGRCALVINHNPGLYFLAPSVGYILCETDGESGKESVSRLYPVVEEEYRISSSLRSFNAFPRETPDSSSEYKAALDKVAALVKNSWSDTEKVLYIHDYLVTHIDYTSYEEAGYSRSVYQAYGALVNGKAVCQGYALAFDDIMGKLGIPCYMISSNQMNHAWNMVQLNGKYYHMDCTWDDPTWSNGQIYPVYCDHENFLRSRSGIISTGHEATDWLLDNESNAYTMTTDSAFDSAPFQDCTVALAPAGSKWGYLKNKKSLYSYDFSSGSSALVAQINDIWYAYNSTSYYLKQYAGLTSIEYNGKAYYVLSGPTVLYVYDPDTGSIANQSGYSIGQDAASGSIYDFIYNDGSKVYYELYQNPMNGLVKTGSVSYEMLMTGKETVYYTVSASVNNSSMGSISPAGDTKLMEGGSLTLTASPKSGYSLKQYIVNGNPVQAGSLTYTIKEISSNQTVQAVFEKIGSTKITSITADTSSLGPVYLGETEYLNLAPLLTILPEDASYKVLKWTSSNAGIASVNGDGTVIPVGNGNAVIKAAALDGSGKSVSIPVEIRTRVNGIEIGRYLSKTNFDPLSGTNLKSRPGAVIQLSALITPSTASNRTVCWTSSDPAVAGVDTNGRVTVLSAGTATITATCEEAAKNGTKLETGVTIDSSSGEITKILLNQTNAIIADKGTNDRVTISATALSSVIGTSQAPDLSWTIAQSGSHFAFLENEQTVSTVTGSSATIVSTGALNAVDQKKTFSATIRATARDGSKVSATCKVTMKNTIGSAVLSCRDIITAGSTIQVSKTFTPSNNLYRNTLSYSCENYGEGTNEARAVIDPATGKLTAYHPGQVVVKASLSDGGGGSVTAKTITIVSPAKNVKLASFSMEKGSSRTLADVFSYTPATASLTIKKLEFLNEKPADKNAAVKTILTNTGTTEAPVLRAEQPGTVSVKLTYETDRANSALKDTKSVSATVSVSDTGALAPKSITVPGTVNLSMGNAFSEMLLPVTTSPLIPGVKLDWKFTDKNGNVLDAQTSAHLSIEPNVEQGAYSFLRLTAKAAGEGNTPATLYLRAFYGEKVKSRVLKATVYPAVSGGIIKKGSTVQSTTDTTVLNRKASAGFTGQITGGISAKDLYWASGDPSVFTVNTKNGKVTAVNEGEAYLSLCSSETGLEVAKTRIRVVNPLTGITLNTKTVTIQKAGTGSVLVLSYNPSDASDKTVSWTCTAASNTGIKDKQTALRSIVLTGSGGSTNASVSSVTTNAGEPLTFTSTVPGIYTIKATAADKKTASFTVKVIGQVTDLSLRVSGALTKASDPSSDYALSLKPGASYTVSPVFTAEYGAVKTCASRSSNTLAATTNKGKITIPKCAARGSTAIVTIMCVDGIHYRTIKVTVL